MSSNHTFKEKIREIIIEIFIIVFAITLSIWLHSWSEHRHQQAEVREFLTGLKMDLENDIEHYKRDSVSFRDSQKELEFKVKLTKELLDSSKTSNNTFRISYTLPDLWCNFNDGRYDGFKSSGKIELIENQTLKVNILEYYRSITEIHRAQEEFKNDKNQVMSLLLSQNEDLKDLIPPKNLKLAYRISIRHLAWIINNQQYSLSLAKAIKTEIEKELK